MNKNQEFVSAIYDGWRVYQDRLIRALASLNADQLALRPAADLRSVGEIVAHIIGARARWFYQLMGEGGDEFEALRKWDYRDAKPRGAEELIYGLESTWNGMHEAIGRWSEEEWRRTWPGEDEDEPEEITRQFVIWHLLEHDLHHGGEVSMILGAHGQEGLQL